MFEKLVKGTYEWSLQWFQPHMPFRTMAFSSRNFFQLSQHFSSKTFMCMVVITWQKECLLWFGSYVMGRCHPFTYVLCVHYAEPWFSCRYMHVIWNSVLLLFVNCAVRYITYHHHHLFSVRRSVQDYKIQMDMEIVTFKGKQGVKPLQSVHQ